MPEINDEVLVAFEHGDIHRPYIIGGVWNGVDPTPRTIGDTVVNGNVRLRESKTRFGHKVTLVDDDGADEKRGYYIQTATGSGHCLRFNDSDQFIELETIGNHKIRLHDRERFIDIETSLGQIVRLDDTLGSITIEARTMINNLASTSISSEAASINHSAGVNLSMESGVEINMEAGGAIAVTAGGAIAMEAAGTITLTAATILLNGVVLIDGVPIPI